MSNLGLAPQCQKRINGCFCDNVYVKNTLYTNRIEPRNGNSLIIDGLDLACITLTNVNTFVGCGAGASLTTGLSNVFVGDSAGNAVTTANSNTFVGHDAGIAVTTGDENTLIGSSAGFAITTGSENTAVGRVALASLTTGTDNVSVGNGSGFFVTTGERNTLVGLGSGSAMTTQSDCVLLGYQTGANNTTSNRLMIANTNTDDPLIDGSFNGETVQVNGVATLGQTGNTTNQHAINGDVEAAAGAINEYLVVSINGNLRKIPLHDIS